jgi:probable DNA metabolism protein
VIVVYDGSFEGYLSLVYAVYYEKITPTSILKEMPKTLILEELYEVLYVEEKSLKVLEALKEKFSKQNFELILNMFMCENSEFELALLEYITQGFKNQKELQNINNTSVFLLQNLQKELFRNIHKMTGFLRFEELEDGGLYARVESKFNLVYFLGRHFSKRFNNQVFYIHDINRALVFLHTQEFKGVKKVAEFELPTLSNDEQKFKKLWKTFFDSVAIESRENKKLQQQLTPLLYRAYMSEFYNLNAIVDDA